MMALAYWRIEPGRRDFWSQLESIGQTLAVVPEVGLKEIFSMKVEG
jgi:hypothetical protein